MFGHTKLSTGGGALHVATIVSISRSIVHGSSHRARLWKKPSKGWVKNNTYDARNPSTGLAACAGIVRDANARWCFGFLRVVGRAMPLNRNYKISITMRG
ncbi:hypothetical protein V6N11_042994 [Hibiscus sabdariffa]|uniref:Uncharacterized protein n=1 Tax=Hibiscus sabdariffa TaxID=183260 RepID=A0ABR2QXY6_9ROSI